MKLTRAHAVKVVEVVDAGLVSGLGKPTPGKMCVEAAICYALGYPHGDEPECVASCIREYKIRINDAKWSTRMARAAGMRRAAVAQLGSTKIDQVAWTKYVAEQVIRRILPIALEAAAKRRPNHSEALLAAAQRCRDEGTADAARHARTIAADASAYDASASASAYASAYAAYDAADASAYAASADASASASAYASAYAADASAGSTAHDNVLRLAAEICVEACVKFKTQGSKWLDVAS